MSRQIILAFVGAQCPNNTRYTGTLLVSLTRIS
jgi:hypothetical protein